MSKYKLTPFEKDFIQERAGRRCEYCKFPFDYSHDAFHIEHIIPLHKNGSNELINLAYACDGCKTNKWTFTEGIDPETNESARLYNPRVDQWEEHFSWSEDFAIILGATPIGRVTIDVLKLNRAGLINVRKALHLYGAHP